jgi:hypothetical protein
MKAPLVVLGVIAAFFLLGLLFLVLSAFLG